MSHPSYKILGRSGAGSLIVEFLFCELGINYEITFDDPNQQKFGSLSSVHPLKKIPILICSDQTLIFETLAIVNHITDRFNKLAPLRCTQLYDRYWQFLSLLGTTIYPGYHRQHHSRYYINENSFKDLQSRAHKEQSIIYDYIEKELDPYICGDLLTAADFYLFMLMRWDLHKDILYKGRPRLLAHSNIMKKKKSVIKVLENQPKRRK